MQKVTRLREFALASLFDPAAAGGVAPPFPKPDFRVSRSIQRVVLLQTSLAVAKSQAAGWDIGPRTAETFPLVLLLNGDCGFLLFCLRLATPFEVCEGAHLDRIRYFAWFRPSLYPQRHGPEGRPFTVPVE